MDGRIVTFQAVNSQLEIHWFECVGHGWSHCDISELTDPFDIEQAVIESNKQRIKTFSQKMREAEELERIISQRKRQEGIEKRRILKTSVQDSEPMSKENNKSLNV